MLGKWGESLVVVVGRKMPVTKNWKAETEGRNSFQVQRMTVAEKVPYGNCAMVRCYGEDLTWGDERDSIREEKKKSAQVSWCLFAL